MYEFTITCDSIIALPIYTIHVKMVVTNGRTRQIYDLFLAWAKCLFLGSKQ